MLLQERNNFHIISRWLFPSDFGGIAMHNYYLHNILNENYRLSIYSIYNENSIKQFYPYSLNFINIQRINHLQRYAKVSLIKNYVRFLIDRDISNKFKNMLEGESGIIEFMDIHTEGYKYLKCRGGGQVAVNIRSSTPFGLLRKYYTKSELSGVDTYFAYKREKTCFELTDSITTPSIDLKERIIELYDIDEKKINVIPCLLDTNHFKFIHTEKTNDEFIILHVGRFERAKGVETLIKAFINLSKKYKNIKLINIGEPRGLSLKKCMDWIEKENLISRIEFTGFVNYDELPSHYAIADVVVVPSEIYESFSYTVAQGMACGKPVIASNIGGIPETLNYGKAGLIFEPKNAADLFEKLEVMINDINKRKEIGEKARLYAESTFSFEVLKPVYLKFYQSLLK
jgi:glycosyltransferase involved in cell wall biosynthesis